MIRCNIVVISFMKPAVNCMYPTFRLIKDEVLLTVGCPIFPPILIAKYLFTGSLKK
jgi:hypothetical protein